MAKTAFGKELLDNPLVNLTSDGRNGKGVVVDYVGYDRGSKRVLINTPVESVTGGSLSFDVKFHDNFQWVKGGKLHGLGPTRPLTGGNPMRPDGWSARFSFKSQGKLAVYVYHQDLKGTYGQAFAVPNFNFQKSRWYNLDLRVWVNSGPQLADGVIEVWIDGVRRLLRSDIRFREEITEDSQINRFLFSTFHGGHAPIWAPVDNDGNYVTVNATVDNFRVGKLA